MERLSGIAAIVGGRIFHSSAGKDTQVAGVSIDTRTLRPGELFFALKGERCDGHDFVAAAARGGAAGAVVSRLFDGLDTTMPLILVADTLVALQQLASFHRRSLNRIKVIAVTGSCGKTTTKEMIARIAEMEGVTVSTRGSENNHIGVPLTLLRLDPLCHFAVTEIGCNHPGEIGLLTEICDPDIGLITCVAPTHTQFLGDIDGVARAKSELFTTMRPQSVAVINQDDARIVAMPCRAQRRVTYTVSGNPRVSSDVRLVKTKLDETGRSQQVTITIAGEEVTFSIPLAGRHNACNAVAAAAAAFASGISNSSIVAGLSKVSAMKGRGAVLRRRGFVVIDESYNSSPVALESALGTLFDLAGSRRRVAILGDMLELGEESPSHHRRAGEKAAKVTDLLVCVGNLANQIAAGALAAGMDSSRVICFADARQAQQAFAAGLLLREGDIVLVKGSRAVKMEIIVETIAGS